VPRPDFPRTIVEFQRRFADDAACRDYLFACRWPEGFRCPACGFEQAYELPKRVLWQCSRCRHQVSVTAGTVLHKTRTPIHLWFWAAYLTSTATPGISALQLQRQLGLKRFETAWFMLHKLRRAMVAPERSPLTGVVEVDDAYVGGIDSARHGGRDALGNATIVLTAAEVRGTASGRIRMEAVDDLSADALCGFVQDNVLEGSTVRTDAWQGFKRLARLGYDHQPRSLRAEGMVGKDAALALPHVHLAISNFKVWLRGTYRGVSDQQMQVYLDEFVFRFNRRRTPMAAFQTLLGIGSRVAPTTYADVRAGPSFAELTG
jgi:ISXO2-like transposase domain/Transposase zinc-ribbon domain